MKRTILFTVTSIFVLTTAAFAATPPKDPTVIEEQDFIKQFGQLKVNVKPRPQDKKANQIAQKQLQGKNAPMPTQGKNGSVQFQFDSSTPRIWCKPLRVTDIELEPGENIVNTPFIGDNTNWSVAPSTSGTGDKLTYHIIIKPVMPDIETNLIVHTDKRTYQFDLVSSKNMYTPHVTFSYPFDNDSSWDNFFSAMGNNDPRKLLANRDEEETQTGTALPLQREDRQQNFSRSTRKRTIASYVNTPTASKELNFNYKIVAKQKNIEWKPIRAYDDGLKTYIDMPDNLAATEAPVFMLVSPAGTREMVNYRLVDRTYVVDRIIRRGVLIAGTGSGAQEVGILNKGRSELTQTATAATDSKKPMNKKALVRFLLDDAEPRTQEKTDDAENSGNGDN